MRQSGYYWVIFYEGWMIAEYDHEIGEWFVCGNEPSYLDEDFKEIGERQIVRN